MNSLANGLVHLESNRSVVDTISILERIVVKRRLAIVARIDHANEAAKVGLTLPPTTLVLFGNPFLGTPIMVASPLTAIDLPLKVLVRQDVEGQVWISYNSPSYLQKRHGIPQDLMGNIEEISSICAEAAHERTDEEEFEHSSGERHV